MKKLCEGSAGHVQTQQGGGEMCVRSDRWVEIGGGITSAIIQSSEPLLFCNVEGQFGRQSQVVVVTNYCSIYQYDL